VRHTKVFGVAVEIDNERGCGYLGLEKKDGNTGTGHGGMVVAVDLEVTVTIRLR